MQDSGAPDDGLFWQTLRAAPNGLVLCEIVPGKPDLRLVRANPPARRLLGLDDDAGPAPSLTACLDPLDRPAAQDAIRSIVARDLTVARLEIRPAQRDRGWLELEIFPLGDAPSTVERAMVQIFDVSDRRWQRRAELVRTKVSQALSQAISVDGALSAVLPSMAEALGFAAATAWRADDDHDDEITCVGQWCHPDVRIPAFSAASRALRLRPDHGLLATARAKQEITATPDIALMAEDPRAPSAAQDGLHAAVALPVTAPAHPQVVLEFLSLEAGPVDMRAAAILEELGATIATGLAEKPPRNLSPKTGTMLLVEDNPFIARLIDEMLDTNRTQLGLEHVERLSDAVAWLTGHRPACIVLDLTLPDADGLQALLEIRRRAPEAPVVVLTGLEDEALAERALAEGAQDYLVKSRVDMHGLSRAVTFAMQRKGAERDALEQQLHDTTTGLPNQVLFLDRLRMARVRADRDVVSVAVLNVDRFRRINDSMGHEAGDRVLIEIARRISAALGPGETLASLGGDEFAVVLYGKDARRLVERVTRLTRRAATGITINGIDVGLTISAGIALDPGPEWNAEVLLQHAQSALTLSKQSDGQIEIFNPELRERLRDRLQLETDLRRAIEEGELRAHFQPLVELAERRTVGFEALVRWQHPERGLLPPAAFLEVAEEGGLIVRLGAWMLDQACAQLAEWTAQSGTHTGFSMNVNLSARELAGDEVVSRVAAALARTRIPPETLCLEVTESTLIADLETSTKILEELKALGVRVALDDFGIGYGSLTYLERFPIDIIKLDRSFVAGLREGRPPAIVAGVADMAAALALDAVAEGIEHDSEADHLAGLGYRYGQGYAFGRPLPASEAGALIATQAERLPRRA